MAVDTGQLSTGRKIGYGAGDLGATLFFQAALLYLIYFYTDVAGIAPAAVGLILLVARTIDAASNPIIGALADRTRTRWGRFRPYLLLGAIPLAVAAFATFSTIPGDGTTKQIYAMVTYTIFSICFALVAIPYSALIGTITTDPKERTALGTIRAGFSFSAGIIVSFVTLPIVEMFGGGSTGFHIALIVFGVIGVSLIWTAFFSTREGPAPKREESPGFRDTASALATFPFILFVLIFFASNIAIVLRSAGAIYYFKYNLGDEGLISAFLTFGAVMTVLGIIATPLVGRFVGKREIMIIGLVMMAVGYIGVSILPPSVVGTFFWLGLLPFFGGGLKAATTWPILADCVDYAEWKKVKRIDAVAYGFAIFAQKLSFALGGAITGWVLSATGYVANVDQTEEALRGIMTVTGYIPAVILTLAVVMGFLYPLGARRVDQITEDLAARKRLEEKEI